MSIRKRIDKIEKRIGLSQKEPKVIFLIRHGLNVSAKEEQNAKEEIIRRFPEQDTHILWFPEDHTCYYGKLVMHFDEVTGEVMDIREKH